MNQPEAARTALAHAAELARTSLPNSDSGDLGGNWPRQLAAQIMLREARAALGSVENTSRKDATPDPRNDQGQTVGSENEDELPGNDAYAEAAFRFFALIEGWPGENRVETGRLLADAFIGPLQERFPEVSKESWRKITEEFQPRLALAFQNLAAHVCWEHFTHDELLELIRFYESRVGKKYGRVYRELVHRMSAGDQHRTAIVEELRERIQRQLTAPD